MKFIQQFNGFLMATHRAKRENYHKFGEKEKVPLNISTTLIRVQDKAKDQ